MTAAEWKALPEFVSREDVLAVGIPQNALDDLMVEVENGLQIDKIPPRSIAFIRGLRGRKDKRKGNGYAAIYKSTVSVLLPREYRS